MVKDIKKVKKPKVKASTIKSKTLNKKKSIKKVLINKKEVKNNKNYFNLNIFLSIIIFILLLLFLFCYSNNDNSNIIKSNSNLQLNKTNSIVNNKNLVAKFNGGEISKSEFNKQKDIIFFLQGVPQKYRSKIPVIKILNQSIIENLIYNEAIKKYGKNNDSQIRDQIEMLFLKSNTNISNFKKSLKNQSFNYEDFIKFYSKQLTTRKFINNSVLNNIVISDLEIKKYYERNKSAFLQKEKIRARHILVNSSKRAKEIITELNNGGNFSKLAKENSIGPSSKNGGDLGFFERGRMVPEFNKAVFALKNINDYTQTPIKTKFGYHIIKLIERKPQIQKSLKIVTPKIKEILYKRKEVIILQNFIEELYKSSNVLIFLK